MRKVFLKTGDHGYVDKNGYVYVLKYLSRGD